MADKLDETLAQIIAANGTDIYIFSGSITQPAERDLNACIHECQRNKNAFLVLTTHGGSADVAYQMVRCLQRNYNEGRFVLFIDSVCKSAGTLIAIGADEIVMSDTAEMGPIDVQLAKPGELGEYLSGLTATQALDTLRSEVFRAFEYYFLQLRFRSGFQVTTRQAADVAAEMAVGTFGRVYEQFEPMRLGENERANLIAYEYGSRIRTENVLEETLTQLIGGYPTHGFVIDRDEAAKLFVTVRGPSEPEATLASLLREFNDGMASSEEFEVRCLTPTGTEEGENNDENKEDVPNSVGESEKP